MSANPRRPWLLLVLTAMGLFGGWHLSSKPTGNERLPASGESPPRIAGELPNLEAVLRLEGDVEFRGEYGEGESVSRVVRVRNISDAPVGFRVLAKSCGCVTTDLSASVIPAGEVLEVVLRTPATVGHQNDHVTHWVGVGAFREQNLLGVQTLSLSYKSARDWRVIPGVLGGMVPIGEEFEFECFAQSAGGDAIELVRVGECSIAGLSGRAERVAESIWRVVLSGRLRDFEEHRGTLAVELVYSKGDTVHIPVDLRAVGQRLTDRPSVIMDVGGAPQVLELTLGGVQRSDVRSVRVNPPSDAVRVLQTLDGGRRQVRVEAVGTDSYGGVIELCDAAGVPMARVPIAILPNNWTRR